MLHERFARVERDGRRGPIVDRPGVSTLVRVDVHRGDRRNPKLLSRAISHNTWVNAGKVNALRVLCGNTSKAFDQIRVGTSGAAVASDQTNVLAPVGSTLTTWGSMTLSGATRTYNFVHSYASGGGSISATDIQEVCVLNQGTSPGGSALNRSTFTAATKTTADRLTITYKLRFT